MSDKIVNHFVLADGSVARMSMSGVDGLDGQLSDLKSDSYSIISKTTSTIERTSTGTTRKSFQFANGRKYKYTNNSTDIINLNVYDSSGTKTVLYESIRSNASVEFIGNSNWSEYGSYFKSASGGTTVLETLDDGVFSELSNLDANYNELQEDVDGITSTYGNVEKITLDELSLNNNRFIQPSNGYVTAPNHPNFTSTPYINIDGYEKITITLPILSNNYPNLGLAFYSLDSQDGFVSGHNAKYNQPVDTYETVTIDVPSSAKYVRTTWFSETGNYSNFFQNFSMIPSTEGIAQTVLELEPRVATLEEEVAPLIGFTPEELTSISVFQTMGVVGDSFSSGGIKPSEDSSSITNHYGVSWAQILGRKAGIDVTNYSSTGADISRFLTNGYTSWNIQKLETDTPRNLYIIYMGINVEKSLSDSSVTVEVGTVSDIDDTDYTLNADTFCGHYGQLMYRIMAHAPLSKIIIVVPKGNTKTEAIISIANHYNVPYIKLSDDEFYFTDFYTDNLEIGHPVALVYAGMANAFDRQITKCMVENIEYFKNYYIGW